MFFLIVLIISSSHFISTEDCGCNKVERNAFENIEIKDQNPDDSKMVEENIQQQKVCQMPLKKSTKYRDYYSDEYSNEPQIDDMSLIPGGSYFVGTNEPHFTSDRESPERLVSIKDFYMDKFEVSNAKFTEFVNATGFITEAERLGDSFIFKTLLSSDMQQQYVDFRVVSAPWWYKVDDVSWRKPKGPHSDLIGLLDHPVVHVSWNDAVAFCKWANKRLPTEIEWEVACRGNKKHKLYPWGNKLMPREKHWLNIWQGEFPDGNTIDDGYDFTCPVDKFHQNIFDMYNIVGNVWEWTQDLWQPGDKSSNPNRVKKGGSYLCHKSYCYRYRCAARSQNTADSSAGNLGFRCAKDL